MSFVNSASSYAARAVGRTAVAFGIRAAGGLTVLVWEFYVASRATPEDAGRFFLAFTVVAVTSTLGRFGIDVLAYREAATMSLAADRQSLGELRRLAFATLAIAMVAVVMVGVPAAGPVFGDAGLAPVLALVALAVVPLGVLAIEGEAMKGAGRIAAGSTGQSLIAPAASLLILFMLPGVSGGVAVAGVYTVGTALAAAALWRSRIGPSSSTPSRIRLRDVAPLGAPFAAVAAANLAIGWTGVVAVAAITGVAGVGEIFLADRVMAIGAMIVVAVNAVIGSDMARMAASGDIHEADRLRRRSQRTLLPVAALLLVVMMLGADLLHHLLGDGYEGMPDMVRILALGQFFVVAAGPSSVFLLMTGGEAVMARVAAATLVMAIVLQLLLVPAWGSMGAAWGISLTWMGNRCLLANAVRSAVRRRSV